jgi:putative ABC transport system permease protein
LRPANLLRLYRVRLRSRFFQEVFAIAGIAAGVALLFASQIASSSLQSSVALLSRGIAGSATLQLRARAPQGFPEALVGRVRAIPGVIVASPLIEASANALGPRGHESVELIGADSSLPKLGGTLTSHTALAPFGTVGAVVLPSPLAHAIGVTGFGQEVHLQIAGHTIEAPLYAQLSPRQIGPLTSSPIAVAPLSFAQELASMPGRVDRILVEPAPGAQRRVEAALRRLAGPVLNVEPVNYDETLFANAAQAANQSTRLVAVISALVGFLFAFNAMLLTVPHRRRLAADLRRDGYTPGTVIAVLMLDAITLGLVACLLGLALGDELSIHLFHSNSAFLSIAFAVGSQRVVSAQSVAIAVAGGMLAAIVAVLTPLRDVLARDPLAVLQPRRRSSRSGAAWRMALVGFTLLAGAVALLMAQPQATLPGMALLVCALLLELPLALDATLALTRRIALARKGTVCHLAALELGEVRQRATAIAATGAVAVFGSVAISGAHSNLLAGLERSARELNADADLWVAPAGSYDLFQTAPFAASQAAALARLPSVRSLHVYRGGLLDYGPRRVLVIAPPPQGLALLAAHQILSASAKVATARLRAGGWVVLSQALAEEHHLHVGQPVSLPTPAPESLRIAALSTNVSWAPGVILMSAADYARAWGSPDPSALAITLAPGITLAQGAHEVERALGKGSGLAVLPARAHAGEQDALDHRALARLSQIATLIPIAAVLAMAAAMAAMIWQRRPRLATLRIEGLDRVELWRTILLESLLLLSAGCLAGALFGVFGQLLADHALASVVNFPVVYSISAAPVLRGFGLMAATSLAILSIPGYLAARVPASLALQE